MGHATELELKSLYEAALEFKNSNLWESVDYSNFFIIHNTEKDTDGFCHMMTLENGGVALSLYLGEEGFKAFKYIFEDVQMTELEHVILKGNLRRHCLTVSFSEKNYVIQEDMDHAMKGGHLFTSVKDQPVFNYSHPDHQLVPVTIHDGWQVRFLTDALKQSVEVLALWAKNTLDIPTLESSRYYLRYRDEEAWKGIFVGANLYHPKKVEKGQPFLNDLLAYRIKKLPQMPITLEAIQFYIPQPVAMLDSDDAFYMLITALVDSEMGQIYFLDINETKDQDPNRLLMALSKQLQELEMRPHYVVAEDEELFLLLQDFCQKTGIQLRQNRRVAKAHEFVDYIINEISNNTHDQDGSEIEELLNFVEEITLLLNSQNELEHLKETEKENYQIIVQTFVLGMYTVKQQTPMEWEVDAFREICETIVPEQFEGELLEAVSAVMTHFVTIMGQEDLIPEYRKILNVVDVFL